MDTLLDISNLSISYFTRAGEVPAVADFNLRLNAGEAVGLVGESGCGKTTVAMAIMRYLGRNGAIVGGSIRFKGRDLTNLTQKEMRTLRGAQISMIYQEPTAALNPSMTLGAQLVEVPIYHDGASRAEAQKRAEDMLASVQLPDPRRIMNSYPHQVSGGQQQRVVIAMALLSQPALLLLDEPTTALDVTVEAGIVELVAEISSRFNTGMLYISHNLGLIRETCDRVCVMYSGEAIESGAVRKVFETPRHPYTRGLFGCVALPSADRFGRPLTPIRGQLPLPHQRPQGCNFGPRCDFFAADKCARGAVVMADIDKDGHQVRCGRWDEIDWSTHRPEVPNYERVEAGKLVLDVHNMSKYYEVRENSLAAIISGKGIKYVKANESLDFKAHKGETIAIVGESGCGKSTFAKVLVGLETATSGELIFRDQDISGTEVRKRSPQQISALQMVFQNPYDTLNPSHTVGGQIMRVIRKFGVEESSAKVRERMLQLLDTVKMPREFSGRRPRQLSGGQKQRVAVARAFAGNPDTVIADEPVSALDVSVAAAITALLLDIQRHNETTLLFISHDLGIVRYLADRVIVMYLGRIVEQGTTKEVFAPPYHPYTEALLAAVPVADPRVDKRRIILDGHPPSALHPPTGCAFSGRCPRKLGEICEREEPPQQVVDVDHVIACHIPLAELSKVEPVFSVRSNTSDAAKIE